MCSVRNDRREGLCQLHLMEKLEDRTLLSATIIDTGNLYDAGNTHVYFFSTSDTTSLTAADIQANVQVKFNADNSIASIALKGKQTLDGLGMLISSAAPVGKITDSRTAASGQTLPNLSFIASSAPIKSLSINSGITGYTLNGFGYGAFAAINDIDGDGNLTDLTSLYVGPGDSGTITVKGTIGQDVVIDGTLVTLKTANVGTGNIPAVAAAFEAKSQPGATDFIAFESQVPGTAANGITITIQAGNTLGAVVTGRDVVITYDTTANGGAGSTLHDITEMLHGVADFTALKVRPYTMAIVNGVMEGSDGTVAAAPVAKGTLLGGTDIIPFSPIDVIINGQGSGLITAPLVTMNFGVLNQVNITTKVGIKSLTAIQAQATDSTHRQLLKAPSLGSLSTTGGKVNGAMLGGNFIEDITIDGGTINSIKIKGGMESTLNALNSRINTLAVSVYDLGSINAASIGTITTKNTVAPIVALTVTGDVGTVKLAADLINTTWKANSIGSLTTPYMYNTTLDLRQPVDAKKLGLGKLTVADSIQDCKILSLGSMGSITFGGMDESTIIAGISDANRANLDQAGYAAGPPVSTTTPDGVLDLPTASQLIAGAKINSIKMVGHSGKTSIDTYTVPDPNSDPVFNATIMADLASFFVNSNIAADHVGTVALRNAMLFNGGVQFGLAFNSYGKITYSDSMKTLTTKAGVPLADGSGEGYYIYSSAAPTYTYNPATGLSTGDLYVGAPA